MSRLTYPRLALGIEIGNTWVVENNATRQPSGCGTPDGQTRRRVAALLLENGQATARELATELGISQVAVRKHLDGLSADGLVDSCEPAAATGRGRPARRYQLTEAARDTFGHHYDDLSTSALRWIQRHGGPAAVASFASDQVASLEDRCRGAMDDAGRLNG